MTISHQTSLLTNTKKFISAIAQCNALNISALHATKEQLITELPYSQALLGNPESGSFHGGSIITLMDTTSGIAAFNSLDNFEVCSTIDLRVDYLRPALPEQSVYAKAHCYRKTANVLFVDCEAYQQEKTVAKCTGTFVRLGNKAVSSIDELVKSYRPASNDIADKLPTNEHTFVDLAANADQNLTALLNAIPYAEFIGLELVQTDNELLYKLKQKDSNIGYPNLPAIHGGVIGGFMQLSAAMQLMHKRASKILPKIIDFSLDYLRAGLNKDTYAKCTITRLGERVANVDIIAWQDNIERPIAKARAHFLLI